MGFLSRILGRAQGRPMVACRLLAFDLDGTFLERDGRLADGTSRFIEKAQAHGVELVAATGRRLWSALAVLEHTPIIGHAVVHNGALIARVPRGEVEHSTRLDPTMVREFVLALRERGFAPLLFTSSGCGPREVLAEEGAPDPTGYLAWYFDYAFGHFSLYPDLADPGCTELDDVLRIVTHGTRPALEELLRAITPLFRGEVRAILQRELVMEAHRIELLPAAVSKWSGVLWIAQQRGIPPQEIVAVGDEANDVEMLANAGYSFAAPGSSREASAAARETIRGDGPADVVRSLSRMLGL